EQRTARSPTRSAAVTSSVTLPRSMYGLQRAFLPPMLLLGLVQVGCQASRVPQGSPFSAEALGCSVVAPIDDFEDGDNQLLKLGDRDGFWFQTRDALGSVVDTS